MFGIIVRWLLLTVSVWVAAYLVPGIRYDDWQSLVVAALVLGVLNTFAKPVLMVISLPFLFVTMGLFLVVINALLLWLTARVVPGFHVDGFWSALFGALIISVVNLFFGLHRRPVPGVAMRRGKGPPAGSGPVIDV